MRRKIQKNNSLIFVGILGVIYLAALLYLKYDLCDISIREFRIDFIGNILNILIAFLLLLGTIIQKYSGKNISSQKKIFVNTVSVISILLLLGVFAVLRIKFPDESKLLFNFPMKKVYVGVLFIVSFFIQIYLLVYVWGVLFGVESLHELRTLVRAASVVLILLVFSLVFVWNVSAFTESKIENRKFEYGFIPGAAVYSKGKPSPVFEGRIRKALEVYRSGIITKIITTGGNAPGEISEAEAAQKFLINLGVNKKNIIHENRSTTTTEQISYLRMNFSFHDGKDSVLIISDGFHLSRAIQISKFYNIYSAGVASEYPLSFQKTLFYRSRESVALLLFWLFSI